MNMIAGTRNFGVGISPIEKEHFIGLAGYDDVNHDNYGNYEYINPRTNSKSKMVFVPAFWYRIGSEKSPRYEKYGVNAIDVGSVNTFKDESTANKEGYSLHRAFIDGGQIQHGFFIDKYLASKDGNETCKSEFGEDPISLTTNESYNPSNGMTGCAGILADAVVLSKSRGNGMQCASVFQYAALGLLSLAHAQASTNIEHNAWYDPNGIINYPKGCNNNALSDVDDTTVTYTNSTPGVESTPKCGSITNLDKTTHNGQASGVADLNGSLFQALVGLTSPGTSSTDTTTITSGNAYVLKPSVASANMTGGFGATNDFWGTSTNLLTNYDPITGLFPWGISTGWAYWGNSTNAVFDGSTSLVDAITSIGYLRTICGLPKDTSSYSATETNQMGKDGIYQHNVANLVPIAAGGWYSGSSAGVFFRDFYNYRSDNHYDCGFRASAYCV